MSQSWWCNACIAQCVRVPLGWECPDCGEVHHVPQPKAEPPEQEQINNDNLVIYSSSRVHRSRHDPVARARETAGLLAHD